MRTRTALAVSLVGLVATAGLAPATAAPKPVKGSFNASAVPDPSATATAVCQGLNPASRFEVPFKVPAAGKLKVELTGYVGDWDLTVEGPTGAILAESAGFAEATTETVQLKFKRATKITIVACNFSGGPTAAGAYVFTPPA